MQEWKSSGNRDIDISKVSEFAEGIDAENDYVRPKKR